MIQLLIIADDFTGALDTGVQFAATGAATRVVVGAGCGQDAWENVSVLVVDAETRHLAPEDAYRTVRRIVGWAAEAKIPYIYKKTDSALRGNIGSELAAALDASPAERLHFIPAFPKMGRITRDGVHYVDALPVAESVFGNDPYEPVRFSDVAQLITAQAKTAVTMVGTARLDDAADGILVYDAETDEDMSRIASSLAERDELHLVAGCAGFAAMLPALLGLGDGKPVRPVLAPKLLIACGSVNPITISQLDSAEALGCTRIRLTPEQKLDPGYFATEQGKIQLAAWSAHCQEVDCCIFDTNGEDGNEESCRYAAQHGIRAEEIRHRVPETLGFILKQLLEDGIRATVFVTGGDTLVGFMHQIGCNELSPVCEIAAGTVLSRLSAGSLSCNVISKSGGFGEETLLRDLVCEITGERVRK